MEIGIVRVSTELLRLFVSEQDIVELYSYSIWSVYYVVPVKWMVVLRGVCLGCGCVRGASPGRLNPPHQGSPAPAA